MSNNIMIKRIIIFTCILFGYIFVNHQSANASEQKTSFWVEFIDVGQGDSALIQCDGHYMLIDGGPSSASSVIYTFVS